MPRGSHLITTEALKTSSCDPHIPHARVEWSFWDLAELLESHGIYLGDQEGGGHLTYLSTKSTDNVTVGIKRAILNERVET